MSEIGGASAVRQESRDISGKHAVLSGLGAILVGLAAVGAMAWMLVSQRGSLTDARAGPVGSPSETSLVERSRIERADRGLELQRQARRRLEGWGWVERGETAHIPIGEATRWFLEDAARGELSWPRQDVPWRSTPQEFEAEPSESEPSLPEPSLPGPQRGSP